MSGPPRADDPLLTPLQERVLDLFARSPLAETFYFGGATALSAVYFQHRYSEDLDFFCLDEFSDKRLAPFEASLVKEGLASRRERRLPVHIFEVEAPDGSLLKLDFCWYPYDRIDRGTTWRGIDVDSVLDIAVNKVHALATRFEDKDLVDIYFLLKRRPDLDLMKLIEYVPLKFDSRVHPLTIAEKLVRAEEIKLMPRMVAPIDREEIAGFLVEEARRIAREVGPLE